MRWAEEGDGGGARHWTVDLTNMVETDGKVKKEVKRRMIGEGFTSFTHHRQATVAMKEFEMTSSFQLSRNVSLLVPNVDHNLHKVYI